MHNPVLLITGERDHVVAHATTLLKEAFCNKQGADNCFCATCRWISNRQHPSLVWINPHGDYTLDDIEIIFEKVRFAVGPGEQFFFVLEQAHNLTPATANRLLKTLEEPPAGYRFLLLSTNAAGILPTIKSRSVVISLAPEQTAASRHPLLQHFLLPNQQDPFAFEAELKKSALNDTQSGDLLEQLALTVAEQYRDAILAGQAQQIAHLLQRRELLDRYLRKPPQSGSSDLFWKQLWLQWWL